MENSQQKVIDKRMYKCPFYGFHMAPGMLLDSHGNQCALIDGYSPCVRIPEEIPSWENCCYNNSANESKIEKIANSFKVFTDRMPKDLINPPFLDRVVNYLSKFVNKVFLGRNIIEGIRFKDWQKYIMEQAS